MSDMLPRIKAIAEAAVQEIAEHAYNADPINVDNFEAMLTSGLALLRVEMNGRLNSVTHIKVKELFLETAERVDDAAKYPF